MKDIEPKKLMLDIAESYEHMAERAERFLVSGLEQESRRLM